jgi:hypothetical protein
MGSDQRPARILQKFSARRGGEILAGFPGVFHRLDLLPAVRAYLKTSSGLRVAARLGGCVGLHRRIHFAGYAFFGRLAREPLALAQLPEQVLR